MPRQSRSFLEGFPVLAVQTARPDVKLFGERRDYETYLSYLSEALTDFDVQLHGFCLLTSQIHLLLSVPNKEQLARFYQSLGRRYVQYFNSRNKRVGTLFDGRFRSCSVDSERYLLDVYRYVDFSPIRTQLSDGPEHYPYTSYAHHIGQVSDSRINDHLSYWQLGNTPFERQYRYKELCREPLTVAQIHTITSHLRAGWHLGPLPDSLNGRQNGPSRRGRPRKVQVNLA